LGSLPQLSCIEGGLGFQKKLEKNQRKEKVFVRGVIVFGNK